MKKLTDNIKNNKQVFGLKNKSTILVLSILVLSIIMLSVGIIGIITNKSPENLVSLATLSDSFILYIEYHILVIAGALGITHVYLGFFKQN